ncbi:hypothetical protein NQ176_g8866 [Zarea fungicola]|uniref:Uncharacterized protein n=1 Tax=Zarea fungicola TaxID=93591 RepID=A0ACC1MQG3_9HYPO|nr:hypothetical protein NQ176_g8866 [Lecanicillium fungicola]
MYDSSPRVPPKDTPPVSAIKASNLGDSEDEKEVKETKPKSKDDKDASASTGAAKGDDAAERVKKATAEAMAESLGEPIKKEESGDKKE